MINPGAPNFACTPIDPARPALQYLPDGSAEQQLVTIITPVFNTTDVFYETALSVMFQTFQQWQWIIVDDGSDRVETRRMLQELPTQDPRIRIVRSDSNDGPGAARNLGARRARTDYIFQLDSDDLLEPTAIEKMLWCLETHPESSFVGSYHVGFGATEYCNEDGFHREETFLQRNCSTIATLVRRSIFESRGYDESIRDGFEDWEFWLRAASEGRWGCTIPEFLSWYRWSGDPMTKWKTWDRGSAQEAFRNSLREKFPLLFSQAFPKTTTDFGGRRPFARSQIRIQNPLLKERPRTLIVTDNLTTNDAPLRGLQSLRDADVGTTVLALEGAFSAEEFKCRDLTSDFFVAERFLSSANYAQFLNYLIDSRSIDEVRFISSRLAYLQPIIERGRQLKCRLIV